MANNIVQQGISKIYPSSEDPIKAAKGAYDNSQILVQQSQEIKKDVNEYATKVSTDISSAKTKLSNIVSGQGAANAFAARIGREKPKNWDAKSGVQENANYNDLVLPYDNPLLAYNNYTWNFKLYALGQRDFKAFQENPAADVKKYVIAQSGVTGRYSIEDVVMTNAGPATPGLTSNYTFNTCNVHLSENSGMSLYNEILVMANELGYSQFMYVPFILELDFVGYPENGTPTVIPGLNRKWGVYLTKINAKGTPSGGTIEYDLTLTPRRAGVVDNKDWTMLEPYSCKTATFGEFVKQIEDQLNSMAEKQYGYLQFVYPEFANKKFFEIHLEPDLENMMINYDAKQSPEAGKTKTGSDAAKNFTWAADVPFSRAIDDVLDCCVPINENTDKKRQFVNIVPIKYFVGNDNIRNTTAYKNVFYIVKYKIGDIVDESDLEDDKFNFDYFYENADKVENPNDPTGASLLNIKRYDYQFTGLNQEILDLELNYNQAFSIAVTRNPAPLQDVDNRSGTHAATVIEYNNVRYNTDNNGDISKMWQVASDLKEQQSKGRELTDSEQQFVRDAQGAAVTTAQQALKVGQQDDQDNVSLSASSTIPQYIEDYRDEYDLTEAGTDGLTGNSSGEVKSMPIEPQNPTTVKSGAKNDNSSNYEMDRRIARDNYYNRTFLSKLDMKVVGDPYWLGWSDYAYIEYLQKIANGQDMDLSPVDLHFANYLNTESYLLLNIKPNIAISDETGILDINQPSVFAQTIYRINKVVSTFSNSGSFTQQLTGGITIRSLRKKNSIADSDERGTP